MMETQTRAALRATKSLHKRLRELEHNPELRQSVSECKKLASDANKAVQAMRKHTHEQTVATQVQLQLMREAVRDELVDRSAAAARRQEKQRVLLEGALPSTLSALDRANHVVASLEASLATICPHQREQTRGVAVLAALADERSASPAADTAAATADAANAVAVATDEPRE